MMCNTAGRKTTNSIWGQSTKGLESLVKEFLIYFTDTSQKMNDFRNGNKITKCFQDVSVSLSIKEIYG